MAEQRIAGADNGGIAISHSARGVMTMLLDRPERGNALGQQMMSGLLSALETARTDERVRVLVLRGAGRHFCSGADISERGRTGTDRIALPDVAAALDGLPKPTVAVVHGACVGGGLALVACCDVVLAEESAFFSVPELRLGLVPTGLLPFFVRALGPRALRRFGLSGERIDASHALRLGVVSSVMRDSEAEIEALLDALLHAAPSAIGQFKRHLASWHASPSTATDQDENPDTEAERMEGFASFHEKRKPAWYIP